MPVSMTLTFGSLRFPTSKFQIIAVPTNFIWLLRMDRGNSGDLYNPHQDFIITTTTIIVIITIITILVFLTELLE